MTWRSLRRLLCADLASLGMRTTRWGVIWLYGWILVPALLLSLHPVTITGDSMQPTIHPGDVVMLEEDAPVYEGAVVAFDNGRGGLTTHRVVNLTDDGQVVTAGDAVGVPDRERQSPEAVRGVVRILVPLAGLPVAWAAAGRWLLVLLALLVGAWVFTGVVRELRQAMGTMLRAAAKPVGALLVLALAVGGLSLAQATSGAAFSGTTSNSGSVLGVPTPVPASNLQKTCNYVAGVATIGLTWTPNTYSPMQTQLVMRSTNGGAFTQIASLAWTAAGHTDLVTPGSYTYRIDTRVKVNDPNDPWSKASTTVSQTVNLVAGCV